MHTDGQAPTEFSGSTYCGMVAGCTPNTEYAGPAAVTPVDPETTDKWWLQTASQYGKTQARLGYNAAFEFNQACTVNADCTAPKACAILNFENKDR